jgi:hypothetical protein
VCIYKTEYEVGQLEFSLQHMQIEAFVDGCGFEAKQSVWPNNKKVKAGNLSLILLGRSCVFIKRCTYISVLGVQSV